MLQLAKRRELGGITTATTIHTLDQLREEDSSWDYRGAFTKHLTHGFHSYPAMMIPQVAGRLIETHSKFGDTVLDPFCGSGSALVEAKVLERNSWGIDLNPVALLVARAKTTPLEPNGLKQEFIRLLDDISSIDESALQMPTFFNLDFWFKPAVSRQLARIKKAIDNISRPDTYAIKEFFLVSFSETVRLSSNSRSHEFKLFRYSPARLEIHNPDPVAIFREKTEKNLERMADYYRACQGQAISSWCHPIQANTTGQIEPIPDESVDVVVTSPPYGDSRTTVAYGQFSRLSAQWLGFEDLAARNLDSNLMGGRVPSSLKHQLASRHLDSALEQIAENDQPRARQVLSFYVDLNSALRNVARKVRPGGFLCVVIGNRRVKRVHLQTDLILAELAVDMGLDPERIIIRNIPNKTMPLKNSPTNVPGELEPTMHREYIVVLRKP